MRPLMWFCAALIFGGALACVFIYQSRVAVVSLEVAGRSDQAQQNWSDSKQLCEREGAGSRLPSVMELIGIYYWRDDLTLHPATDYWSNLVIANYAFGLNSRRGWLSFDRLNDEDHALCVR